MDCLFAKRSALFLRVTTFLLFLSFLVTACSSTEVDMLQTAESPDGEYIAYAFEKNSGATSPFIYRLTVLKKDDKFKESNGNTYISYSKFTVEWQDNETLVVSTDESTKSYKEPSVFKQEKKIYNVNILYQTE